MAAHVKDRRGLAPRQVGTWRPVVDRESADVGAGGGGTLRKNPELQWQQAAEINRACGLRWGEYLEERQKMGRILEELKPQYGHGQWINQLQRWAIDVRTAQRAMRDAFEERHPEVKARRLKAAAERRANRNQIGDTVSYLEWDAARLDRVIDGKIGYVQADADRVLAKINALCAYVTGDGARMDAVNTASPMHLQNAKQLMGFLTGTLGRLANMEEANAKGYKRSDAAKSREQRERLDALLGVHPGQRAQLHDYPGSSELPSGAAGRGSGEAAGFSRGAEPPPATNRAPRGGEDRYSHDAATRAAVHATAGQSSDELDKSGAEPVRNVTHGDTKAEFSRGTPWSAGEPGVMSGPETIRPVETKSGDVTAGETAPFDSSKHRSRRAVIGGTGGSDAQLHFAELYEAAQAAHALIERLVKAGSLEQIRAMLAVGGGSQVAGGGPVGAPVAEVAGAVLSPVAADALCGSSAAFSLSPPPAALPTGAAGFSARSEDPTRSVGVPELLSPPRVGGAVGNGRAVI